MTRRDTAADRALRAELRAADPAAIDPAAEAAALARLARRVGAIAPRHGAKRRILPLVLLPAAAALVAAVLWLGRVTPPTASESAPPVEPFVAPPAAGGGEPHVEPRQLQFETPGGTRVVWLLDPNLSL